MGVSIGELFLSLGFDVDDSKLKGFNEKINSGLDGMLKMSTAAISATTALNGFVLAQSNSAMRLANLRTELGLNTDAVQRWASVVNQTNPLISVEDAQNRIAKLQEALADVSQGGGPSGALSRLAGRNVAGMKATDVLEVISANRENFLRENNNDPAIYSKLLNSVAALAPFQRALALSPEQRQKMGITVSQETLDSLDDFSVKFAHFEQVLSKISKEFAADVVPALEEGLKRIETLATETLSWAKGFRDLPDTRSRISKIGEYVDALGASGYNFPDAAGRGMKFIWNALQGGAQSIADSYSETGAPVADESRTFWQSRGYSPAAVAALLANEKRESGFDPQARGDNGEAYGSFQWHMPRIMDIMKNTGIDVRTASHWKQLSAAADELERMGLADKLKNMSDAGDAAALISKKYERPANGVNEASIRAAMAERILPTVTQNNTFHVSGDNPQAIAAAIDRQVRQQVGMAYSTQNLGPNY